MDNNIDNNIEEMFSMYLGMNTKEEIINNKFTSFVVKHNKIDLSNFGSKLYLTSLVHNLCIQYLFSDIYYIILKSNLGVLYNKKFSDEDVSKFINSFKKFSFALTFKELSLDVVPLSERNKIYKDMNLIKNLEELSLVNSNYFLNNKFLYEELRNNNILIFDNCKTAGCIKCAKVREDLSSNGITDYLEIQNKTIYDRIGKQREYKIKARIKTPRKENK